MIIKVHFTHLFHCVIKIKVTTYFGLKTSKITLNETIRAAISLQKKKQSNKITIFLGNFSKLYEISPNFKNSLKIINRYDRRVKIKP